MHSFVQPPVNALGYQAITKAYTTVTYRGLVETVEHLLPVSSIVDYIGFPENTQVSAYCRLGQTDLSGNVADRHFPGCQQSQNLQARAISESLEVFAECSFVHRALSHVLICISVYIRFVKRFHALSGDGSREVKHGPRQVSAEAQTALCLNLSLNVHPVAGFDQEDIFGPG